jgi:hypothetical protein
MLEPFDFKALEQRYIGFVAAIICKVNKTVKLLRKSDLELRALFN